MSDCLASKAPVKLHFSWFVFRRGMTTERTGMLGLYFAMSLAARPEEVKQMITDALTLIAART
jgi:hypothetical protein